jgi:two-component system chemotaxis response regulator CheB
MSVTDSSPCASELGSSTLPWLVTIAASAGGIQAIGTILAALPPELPAAIVLVQHRTPDRDRYLSEILSRVTPWPVHVALPGEAIEPGHVYLARADSHLTVTPARAFQYRDGTKIRFVRLLDALLNPPRIFTNCVRSSGPYVASQWEAI